jgi:hypothetical protein
MAVAVNPDASLRKAMNESLKAYGAGNEAFFDFLTDDVRVYGLDSSEPIVGRKNFQERFEPTFGATRKIKKVHQDVRMIGEQAVLSQTLQITVSGVSMPVRQTVIWEGGRGNWRMSHIHNAHAGQPVTVGAMPSTVEGIRILNERIATAAAVVGVAQ